MKNKKENFFFKLNQKKYWYTLGIFSHKLTDSTDTFGSKPIAGRRGQPLKRYKNKYKY